MGCWEYDEGNGWKTHFVVHTGSCAVRAGSRSIPDLVIPSTGDHSAGTELGGSLQDRQKQVHPSAVTKINYLPMAADY
jgi:hypothetical protein